MKEKIKKISKFITSRMFYFLVGLLFALAIPIAYAAWNSIVSSGQTLTPTLWNDVVGKLTELNNKIDSWPPGNYCIMANGGCPAGFAPGTLSLGTGNSDGSSTAVEHDWAQCDETTGWVGGSQKCWHYSGTSLKILTLSFCCK